MSKWGVCVWCGKLVPADRPTRCGAGTYGARPKHMIIPASVADDEYWREHGAEIVEPVEQEVVA